MSAIHGPGPPLVTPPVSLLPRLSILHTMTTFETGVALNFPSVSVPSLDRGQKLYFFYFTEKGEKLYAFRGCN